MKKSIYIASSWKNQHAVEMLTDLLEQRNYEVKSFIRNANEERLNAVAEDLDRWIWSEDGERSFDYDTGWAAKSDIVIYLGPSGCDAWAEIGITWASKRPIYALKAKGEPIGLMRRLVTKWFDDYKDMVEHISKEHNTSYLVELEELFDYGFERIKMNDPKVLDDIERYVKNVDGVSWSVFIEHDKVTDTNKVCIAKDRRVVRYCSTMEDLTEKLTEFNLLK